MGDGGRVIVTEGQINQLHRGARVELEIDSRPTIGETYAAHLAKGQKRSLDVTVVNVEKIQPGRWRVVIVKGARVEAPLLLKARPGTDDYTERPGLAMRDEPEPIDPKARDAYAERARAAADAKRAAAARRPPDADLQQSLDSRRRAERHLLAELDERFVDLTPHEVVVHAPHQGTVAEVRERRRANGRRAVDGRLVLNPDERAQTETWLRDTAASVREIARALDCSMRRAHALWRDWNQDDDQVAA